VKLLLVQGTWTVVMPLQGQQFLGGRVKWASSVVILNAAGLVLSTCYIECGQ
jgi:hypothetical protein